MNILLYISSLSSGGAERVAVNLANYWAKKGWHITIVTLHGNNKSFYSVNPSIELVCIDVLGESKNIFLGLYKNLTRILKLRRIIQQKKPQICLSIMDRCNVILSVATLFIKGMVKLGNEQIHPPQEPLPKLWMILRKVSYYFLDAIVVLTEETKLWIEKHTFAKDVCVIQSPIPWPFPESVPYIPFNQIKNRHYLLAVGRLTHQKGFDLLLQAFSLIASQILEWDLIIIGEGNERKNLESLIERYNLCNRVLMPGRVGNIGEWYIKSELYVMSSRWEGFPNTLVEALAHGMPSISFDCDTGPRDIIHDGIDGVLVANGNVKQLADAIFKTVGNKDFRNNLAKNAINVRSRFALDRISEMWENLFYKFLK